MSVIVVASTTIGSGRLELLRYADRYHGVSWRAGVRPSRSRRIMFGVMDPTGAHSTALYHRAARLLPRWVRR